MPLDPLTLLPDHDDAIEVVIEVVHVAADTYRPDPVPVPVPVPVPMPTREPAWAAFDAEWYQQRYAAALSDVQADGICDVVTFYRLRGRGLGHSPNMFFDEEWYLAQNPDVAGRVASGEFGSGFEHYRQEGFRDRAPHWLFDEKHYLQHNSELAFHDAGPADFVNGYDHYLTVGDRQLRSGHPFFDPALYRQNALEEAPAGEDAPGSFARFLAGGCRAGSTARVSWYFDPVWYLERYPEVAKEIARGLWLCALHHFLGNATPQAFMALEWFEEEFYANTYPDVLQAVRGGTFRNTYDHFIKYGAAEARRPHPDIDLAAHVASPGVQAALLRHEHRDGFAHWIAALETSPDILAAQSIPEAQSKQLFGRMAEAMLSQFVRSRLDFTVKGEAEVSVIVVLHNKFALTMTALSSLRACFAGGIELVLVDSGSRDETQRIGRYLEGARIIRFDHNAGFVEACNAALAHCTAPAVLYLNNDLTLGIKSVELALRRLASDERIGAVGAKFIRTDGSLQEAGSIIWRDGSTAGYLRDADPNLPEANFVRDVDFCSGAFLMVRGSVLRELGGFDDDFRPAYYEETDLCVRMKKAGYRIVYDPSVVVQHVEFGSANSARSARMIQNNHKVFVEKHRDWLRYKHPPGAQNALFARSQTPSRGRILFIEDRIPLRALGSGYVRANDIVACMASLGYEVSVYPVFATPSSIVETLSDFPEGVEVLYDRGVERLPAFIAERAGYYDILWIGRTHNLDRLLSILSAAAAALPRNSVVLDTEAVSAPRSVERARVLGLAMNEPLEAMLKRELVCAYFCQRIVAVNERDAVLVRSAGYSNVSVLGHMLEPAPTPAGFHGRGNLLFIGAIHDTGSPNYDSLNWFIDEVLPLLRDRLPPEIRFTIAGYVDRRVDMSVLARDSRVRLVGPVEDLAALYARHRVFVAPTRFAGGIPFKVHEAASFGVPVVASELICRQVGWEDGVEILSGGTGDAARFADQVMQAYQDGGLWNRVREGALRRIAMENDRQGYLRQLDEILMSVTAGGEARRAG